MIVQCFFSHYRRKDLFSLYSLCLFGVGGVPLAAATAATIDVLAKK